MKLSGSYKSQCCAGSASHNNKSFLLLFFKKEESSFPTKRRRLPRESDGLSCLNVQRHHGFPLKKNRLP
jgi:hypothetical protein